MPCEWVVTAPRTAALLILLPRFPNRYGCDLEPHVSGSRLALPDFQREAVQRATGIMDRRGGVLLADSVGLGKTFVALGLIEAAVHAGRRTIVTAPASLRRMWRTELRRIGLLDRVDVVSHTSLALHGLRDAAELLVVDEAHAFRNPRTRRFRALRQACRGARVALLTATPVNNSLWDLYFQLRLFCSDGAFRDLGIGSLRAAFAEDRDVDRVLRAVMVRRTRAEVRNIASDLRFPARVEMTAIAWTMPVPPGELREFLLGLEFVPHRIATRAALPVDVLRFGLLKRLESSGHAARCSLGRLIRFYEEFMGALRRGRLLDPAAFRSLYRPREDALQLVLEPIALAEQRAPPEHLLEDAQRELAVLRRWSAALAAGPDDKLLRLEALLRTRPRGARTLVFSEYRETARYLWRALRRHFAVGLIDGEGAWIGEAPATRTQVVERFAPIANHARPVHAREVVEVLIATDVLAEGMNLQDADAIVSYDLPWNPVRLIQRAGRIDRIGSPHDVVRVYNFLPDREFDALLGLARTLRRKLETVRSSVGLERSVLEPGDAFEEFARGLKTGASDLLDRLEDPDQARLRAAFEAAGPLVHPDGIPIARLARGSRGSKTRLVVGLARGGDWDVVVLDAVRGVTDPDSKADALLLAALADASTCELDTRPYSNLANDYLRGRNQASDTAPLGRESAASRIAASLRRLLAASSRQDDVVMRADAALGRLARAAGAWRIEARLEALATRGWTSVEALLSAVEQALGDPAESALPVPVTDEEWRITGLLIVD